MFSDACLNTAESFKREMLSAKCEHGLNDVK